MPPDAPSCPLGATCADVSGCLLLPYDRIGYIFLPISSRMRRARHGNAGTGHGHFIPQKTKDRRRDSGQNLPSAAVIHDAAEVKAYECDALTAYTCPPLAVVLPASTEDVATALRICHAEGVPVVPRGSGHLAGRWGAADGRQRDPWCPRRLNKVLEVDYDNRFIPRAVGAYQPECDGCGRAGGFLLRTRPLLAAGLLPSREISR